jgi:hypothetical protein
MSKLVRTLMLGAMLAAMNLAAVTAVAQERTSTGHAAELFRAGERASTTHRDDVGTTPAEATRPARPAGPLGRPGLLVTLGVLAAALAAVTAARATRRVRARQAV